MNIILAGTQPIFADDDGAIFVVTLPNWALDLVAMFDAIDDDTEQDDAPEHNDGGEIPTRVGVSDPDDSDMEEDDPAEDGDDETDFDNEADARDLAKPTFADPHDQTPIMIGRVEQ